MLAGISAEYYLRLEQGRDKNPSQQILDALARALQLDIKGTEYLYQLAGGSHGQQPDLETAADGLDVLIDQFSMPAIVANRYQDVLAANAIARALSPGFVPGQNFLRWRLVEPVAREFFVDWDDATDIAVSGLREVAGGASNDPRMRALVAELSAVVHDSANSGPGPRSVTAPDSRMCATLLSVSCTFIATGSAFPIRVDSM